MQQQCLSAGNFCISKKMFPQIECRHCPCALIFLQSSMPDDIYDVIIEIKHMLIHSETQF